MTASTTLTIRISPELKDKLNRLSDGMQRSVSYIAARALEDYVAYELPNVEGILRGMEDVRNGNTIPHDEAMAELEAIIEAARRKVA